LKNKTLSLIGLIAILVVSFADVRAQFAPQIIPNTKNQQAIDLAVVSNFIKLGEIPRAIAILDRLKDTYGDIPQIKDLYKQAYKEGKLYKELEEYIRTDLAKDPQNPSYLADLGETRFLQDDEKGADSLWSRAIILGRTDQNIYRIVADDMMRYGLYDFAINTYLKGRQNLGNSTIFSAELANLYETQRDYPKAINEFLTQVLEEPTQLGFVSVKIRGYWEDLGESDDPQQIFRAINSKIKEFPDRTELYEILGDLYIKSNQIDKAFECYKTISQKQNDDGQALIKFAMRAYDSKAYGVASNAVGEYFRLSKKATSKNMAYLIKARSLLALGQVDSALADFKALSENSADLHIRDEAGFSCGLIYAQYKNDCDSALLVWDKMQKVAADVALQGRARLEMAICYLKKDDLTSADDLIKQVRSSRVDDYTAERASFLSGEASFYKGKFEESKDSFKQLIRNYPQGDHANDALLRLEVINICGDDSANQKYMADFSRALKALDLGQPLDAAQILSDSSLANSPIAEQAAFYSATAFAAASDKVDAISAYKQYIDRYPDGLYIDRAYLGLGDLYVQDPTTYNEAKAAYDKILEAFPDGPVTEVARQRLQRLISPEKIG
jgi:tetratricopeptide (TPR) repeat protein